MVDKRRRSACSGGRHHPLLSERLFGPGNSVGRSLTFSGQPFKVIGVIDRWLPKPRFYDAGNDFSPPDDLFIPFRWAESLSDLRFQGFCQQTRTDVHTFKEIAPSECISTGLWTELADKTQYREYRQFLDSYSRAQQRAGRFVDRSTTDSPMFPPGSK